MAAFRGNRFNILFYDVAGVYYLKSHMIGYLTSHHSRKLNLLLQAVLSHLKSRHYVAGCKALGIIDKIVTGPFWMSLQDSSVSILEMSKVYTDMKMKFDEWGNDAQCLVDKEDVLFPDYTDMIEAVSVSLFEPSEEDGLVQELLQLLFKSFSQTIQRLLIDHLPDGQFHDVTDDAIIAETRSVPKTNVNPERDFAILDRLISKSQMLHKLLWSLFSYTLTIRLQHGYNLRHLRKGKDYCRQHER